MTILGLVLAVLVSMSIAGIGWQQATLHDVLMMIISMLDCLFGDCGDFEVQYTPKNINFETAHHSSHRKQYEGGGKLTESW